MIQFVLSKIKIAAIGFLLMPLFALCQGSVSSNFTVNTGNLYWQYWYSFPSTWQANWTAPGFTLDANLTDQTTIYFDVRGQMNTDAYVHANDGILYTGIQNAAGIMLPGSVASKPVGSIETLALNLPNGVMLGNSAPVGSLLIGNPTIGWVPLFAANSTNGLGSANPPTTLTLSTNLRSIFGRELPSGTKLYLTYNDQDDSNIGSYAVSMSYDVFTSVSNNFTVNSGNSYWQYWYSYPSTWQENWTAPNFSVDANLTDQTAIYFDVRGQMNTDPYVQLVIPLSVGYLYSQQIQQMDLALAIHRPR